MKLHDGMASRSAATTTFENVLLQGGLPCMVGGSGPPLVVLPGLSAEHRHPMGPDRWMQLGMVRSLAQRFTVHVVSLPPHLPSTTTMQELATAVAVALEHEFARPVAVEGVSAGGSVALQMAVDHPERVDRLVLVSAACRLGTSGRAVQRRLGDATEAGRPRTAWAATGPALTANRITGRLMAALLWLTGTASDPEGPSDLLATIRAEDTFDVCDRLDRVTAPTLIVAGGRDGFYSRELFEQTARGIRDARLVLYPYRGHAHVVASSDTQEQILRFLSPEPVASVHVSHGTRG
jgi:pimeloyl-ACP methyl ester carboxylesterase